MPDFNVRSDSVNVEQIMEQIRARIREKRGVDYTEQQIQEMANVKLEKFLDPRGVRSDLLEQFRRAQPPYSPPDLPNYAFEAQTLFESHRGPLRLIRKLLLPILKLFFNPNPLIHALNIQARLNTMHAEREARNEAARRTFDSLHYEVLHNLVVETTRMGIEVKNLKMRVESLTSRLEFNERRARALESVVVYKPSQEDRLEPPARDPREAREPRPVRAPRDARESKEREPRERESRERESRERESREPREIPVPPVEAPQDARDADIPSAGPTSGAEGPGQRSRRRRRRRGRRGGGSVASLMGETPSSMTSDSDTDDALEPEHTAPSDVHEPASAALEPESPSGSDSDDPASTDHEQ
jgi:hypothetical protein